MPNTKKQNKVFSKIDTIPSGRAPDTVIPGCMVLEGGAFRGVYGEGVLDLLMEAGINLSCTIGVSAGAMNGSNYASGQIGRSARINLTYRHDNRYVGAGAIRENQGIIGFRFAFEDYDRIEPLDRDRLNDPRRRFIAVATDCNTGKPVYFENGKCSDILQAIRASASMPYLSKVVYVDGIPCLDGGCSVKVPYQWALDQGYEKIVVIRSRMKGNRREIKSSEKKMADLVYGRRYPAFAAVQGHSSEAANRQCDEMDRLEAEKRIFVISPSRDLGVGRLEKNMEKLGALYYLGFKDAKRALPELRAYLEA